MSLNDHGAISGSVISSKEASIFRVTALIMSLLFTFEFCTVLVDTLMPKLKAQFALSYTDVMLIRFFLRILYFSLSASRTISRIGYLQSITLGLSILEGLKATTDFRFFPYRTQFDLYKIGEDSNGLLKEII